MITTVSKTEMRRVLDGDLLIVVTEDCRLTHQAGVLNIDNLVTQTLNNALSPRPMSKSKRKI